MRKVKHLFLVTLAVYAVLLVGCKTEGCMDMDSVNYNAGADVDDGSCRYEGQQALWFNETASKGLIADGATNLTVKIDGTSVGSISTSSFLTASPECGVDGAVTITQDLGNVKTQAFSYSVEDQTGFVYWEGVLNFNANTCTRTELGW